MRRKRMKSQVSPWTIVPMMGCRVRDYLTMVREGAFYGWPYSYWGQHVDIRVHPQRPDLVAKAIKPDYGLSSHVAALGLAFSKGEKLSRKFGDGIFVGEHGSWDRSPVNGYQVIFLPLVNGRPEGKPIPVVIGFLGNDNDTVRAGPWASHLTAPARYSSLTILATPCGASALPTDAGNPRRISNLRSNDARLSPTNAHRIVRKQGEVFGEHRLAPWNACEPSHLSA